MARKPVYRDLPPANQLFQGFPGFAEQESKQAALTNHLRKIARQLQRSRSRPFYSMREVALLFSLPLRTVAQGYATLEHEGLLNRRRSSQTLLVGRRISPRKLVRAVVGIPLWLNAIVVSPYSRVFHIEIGDCLKKHGFVADFIFFRGDEVTKPDFARRLIDHQLDYVIWHTPHPHGAEVLHTIREHGVIQIVIQSTESSAPIHSPTYLQDWQSAYHNMAKNWNESGIRHVLVPDPVYLPSQRAKIGFKELLKQYDLNVEFVREANANVLLKSLSRFQNGRAAIAFIDQEGAETICNEDPVIIEHILTKTRIGLCRGPIRLPYFHHREASVDIVCFSPVEMSNRIASELSETMNVTPHILHTFQASFLPQVSFKQGMEIL